MSVSSWNLLEGRRNRLVMLCMFRVRLGFFVVSLEERGMRAKDECGVGGRWWYQGEGGESVMGRGEKRRRRRQLASGERNRRQLGKKRNGREGRFKN